MNRRRVRIRFRKEGDLRLLGHRDLVRLFERLFRRAGLSLAMSEGFHPKPRMSFPSALALGIAASNELFEVQLLNDRPAGELLDIVRRHAPNGLTIFELEDLPMESKKAQIRFANYTFPVPCERRDAVTRRIAAVLDAAGGKGLDSGDETKVDLRDGLEALSLDDGVLLLRVRMNRPGGVRPRDVLAALGLEDLERQGCFLTRTSVEVA